MRSLRTLLLLALCYALGCDTTLDENFHPGLASEEDSPTTDTPTTDTPTVDPCALPSSYNVELVAGTISTSGFTVSTLLTSLFDLPSTMLFLSDTQMLVRDENNFRIRLVDFTNDTTAVFAGNGTEGISGDGGALLSAQFDTDSGPGFMVQKSSGDIFLSSPGHYIRRISGGNVFSFSGLNGTSGTADGNASTARFNLPSGIAMDSSENIYVADNGNHCIRKVDATGTVTTLAGLCGTSGNVEGTGSAARLTTPFALAIDSSGNLYATSNSARIYKITPAGAMTFFAGDGTAGDVDGTGTAAQISPVSIAIDSCDTLFFTDINNKVKRLTTAGVVETVAGDGTAAHTGDGGPALSASIAAPASVTVHPTTKEVYFTEIAGHTIRKLVAQ